MVAAEELTSELGDSFVEIELWPNADVAIVCNSEEETGRIDDGDPEACETMVGLCRLAKEEEEEGPSVG